MAIYCFELICILVFASYGFAVNPGSEVPLNERLRRLEERLDKQEAVNNHQAETIKRLEMTNRLQQETIKKHEEINGMHGKWIHLQQKEIQLFEHTLNVLYRNQGNITEAGKLLRGTTSYKYRGSKKTLNLLPTPQRRMLLDTSQYERIVFSSYLDHNVQNIGIDQPIIYNQILLNEGSAYNQHSGMFTCPMDGIYGFYFSVSTQNVNQIVAKLVVDSVNLVDGVSDTFHDNHEAQGGNFVFVSLKQGQQVWVANYRWASHSMQETDIYRFSTFSGFLLN